MTPSTITDASIGQLKEKIQGDILLPGDNVYEEARAIWNGMIDRRPALIVCCENTNDVIKCVHFANQNSLPISVKGGGHGVAGKAVCDNGLMIDFSRLAKVSVDPENQTAMVQPGAKLGDLDSETSKYGLFTTGGIVSTTGVAGLTLGGGIGYLARKHGLALDNVLALEVVTADGRLLCCSHIENQELFWALRGGGGNFGIVVSFKFRLHKENPNILAAQIFYPMTEAPEIMRAYRDLMLTAPDELAAYALVVNIPPAEPFPEGLHGTPAFFLLASYAGDHDEGRKLLEPLQHLGSPILAVIDPMPYVELQKNFDPGVPKGARYYWKHHLMSDLSDAGIATFLEYAGKLKGPMSLVGFEPFGGAIARINKEDTAFPGRNAKFALGIWTGWIDPYHDNENIKWTREFHRAMKPFASEGFYTNYLDHDEDSETQNAYGNYYQKLQKVKAKYDPDNFFSQNFNIKPGN
jgi:FAD/FMN-containing dehydrogenase